MDIFSLCNEKSIKAMYEELESFRLQSGFTVSYDKTTLYRIGSLRHSDAQLYAMDQFIWSNKDISVLRVTLSHEDIIQKNYKGLCEKTRKILGSWENRGLSLIGKVQVVNTLIASLFVYKMMVLPRIPDNIVKTIDNIIREFLWNGRKSKINYQTLQIQKKEGGLNLVNLKNKDIALKSTWPQILHQEKDYANLVYTSMRCNGIKEDIWRCNLKSEDVRKLKISNSFWEDVLRSWAEYNYYTNVRIENQLIWYNSRIQIGKKPFMWNDVHERGLKYVHQLFKDQNYKSEQEVLQEYGLTQLRFNSLKSAIPADIKEFFQKNSKESFLPLPPHNLDLAIHVHGRKLSGKVYRALSDDAMLIHAKYIKWKLDLGPEYSDGLLEFAKKHTDIYRTTNIAKYRSFQYRLLQRGLVTNIELHKWGKKDSDSCTFCRDSKETTLHLLWECPKTQELWRSVGKYLEENFQSKLQMSAKNVIFNSIVKNIQGVENFLCLVTKQYIYSQKCLGKEIHFPALLCKMRQIENIEKFIATKNGKVGKHNRKWRRI